MPAPRQTKESTERSETQVSTSTRFMVEIIAASASSCAIAPLVAVIDQAITSNASGRERMLTSVLNSVRFMCTSPVRFMKSPSVLIMFGVYAGTYSMANLVDASFELYGQGQSNAHESTKMAAVSATNISLINAKDIAFARLFGQGPSRPFPRISMGLFMVRDSCTIAATFSPIPGLVSKHMLQPLGVASPDTLAMLLTPMSVQALSAPLHLLGLDLYNRNNVAWKDRLAFIRREFVSTAIFRMARALPAFGLGGVINKHLRSQGKQFLSPNSPGLMSSESY